MRKNQKGARGAHECQKQILKGFYQEFGMTPAARTRIELPWSPNQTRASGKEPLLNRLGEPI